MKTNVKTWIRACLLAVITAALIGPPAVAVPDEADGTEDIIFMLDGRELHGQIIEETRDAVVFNFVDRRLNISTRLTLLRDEIARIDRDVALEIAEPTSTTSRPKLKEAKDEDATYGAARAVSDDAPSFYIIPMHGQMGTDVHVSVYEEMLDEIRAYDPDYLIIKMDCKDTEVDKLYSEIERADRNPTGIGFIDGYQELVNFFHDELRDVEQVLWIQDSVGISSAIALSWDQVYISPNGHLGGLEAAAVNFLSVQEDFNTLGKYREAYMALLKGLTYGRCDPKVVDAMVRPEFTLSASWEGRDVNWRLDESGVYLVDGSDEHTVNFRARDAENLCLVDATVENLDDIALMLGIREYRVIDGRSEEIFEDYVEDWRRALENCKTWGADYNQYLGWANGSETLQYIGRAKGCLEKIIAAMKRYDAVETRLAMENGINIFYLETLIEQHKEQIRALRESGRSVGSSGGSRGRGVTGNR